MKKLVMLEAVHTHTHGNLIKVCKDCIQCNHKNSIYMTGNFVTCHFCVQK